MNIQPNTFAETCYNHNSVVELRIALSEPADETDMLIWELTEAEYYDSLRAALDAKQSARRA